MAEDKEHYVTTRELSSELRSMRWEMRALILLAAIGNIGLGYKANLPGITQAVGLAVGVVT